MTMRLYKGDVELHASCWIIYDTSASSSVGLTPKGYCPLTVKIRFLTFCTCGQVSLVSDEVGAKG